MANRKRRCANKDCGKYRDESERIILQGICYCDVNCAYAVANANIATGRAKLFKGEPKPRTKKTKLYAEKLTDADFSKVQLSYVNPKIRERDKGLPCISCGTSWKDGHEAGHYYAIGSQWRRSWLRYHPYNINGQCRGCNGPKSGNQAEYADGIIDRFGVNRLNELKALKELAHKSPPLSYDDLQLIQKGEYKFPVVEV